MIALYKKKEMRTRLFCKRQYKMSLEPLTLKRIRIRNENVKLYRTGYLSNFVDRVSLLRIGCPGVKYNLPITPWQG